MNLNELKDRAYKTAKAHGWHDKELSDETYLMLIITEIAEAVQADRKGIRPDIEGYMCRVKNIDIDWHVEQKMRYNELRSYKHGNKKY